MSPHIFHFSACGGSRCHSWNHRYEFRGLEPNSYRVWRGPVCSNSGTDSFLQPVLKGFKVAGTLASAVRQSIRWHKASDREKNLPSPTVKAQQDFTHLYSRLKTVCLAVVLIASVDVANACLCGPPVFGQSLREVIAEAACRSGAVFDFQPLLISSVTVAETARCESLSFKLTPRPSGLSALPPVEMP